MPNQNQSVYFVLLLSLILGSLATVKAYYVEINCTGSSVIGGTVNFSAVLYDDGQVANKADYKFYWEDNSHPANNVEIDSKYPYSKWSVTYPMNTTKPGDYRVTLKVDKTFVFWINIATNHVDFKLDESLGGELLLLQNNTKRKNNFISTANPVNHTVQLRPTDAELLAEKAYEVQTYWFRNCTYIGVVNGLSYVAQYTEPEESYKIEALVVATFEKPPEPTTTTTTTTTTTPKPTTTTTTKTTTSTTTTTTTTPKPSSNTTTTKIPPPSTASTNAPMHRRRRRGAAAPIPLASNLIVPAEASPPSASYRLNGTASANTNATSASKALALPILMSPMSMGDIPPYDCVSGQFKQRDPNKLYGLFKHYVYAKAPISDFKANGQNWLKHGDLLHLQVNCKGSASLEMCIEVYNAPYNATGNETCRYYFPLDKCELNFTRFFYESKTVLFFIRNEVSAKINQVTINIYEAKVQSQLSVVVVPVSFTLIAVILIVFGVSYYIQSRNRFTVEVADFNFGETQSVDMEYKTFQQRLVESVREVWPWRRRYTEFDTDMEPEVDHNGGIGSTFDNSADHEEHANAVRECEDDENNATTTTASATNGNAAIDSNLRYNSLT